MATQTLTLMLLLLTTTLHLSTSQNNIKGAYWFPESEFPVSSINTTLFTHLYCAFANLNSTTYQLSIPSSCSSFTSTVHKSNPSIITLLSIGGGNSDPSTFSSMASQPSSRKTFIDSSISLARTNGFSGLDLDSDWQYPQTTTDMTNFAMLVTEWCTAINDEAQTSGNSALLLTAAISVIPPASYPVSSINASMDFVNIMVYDFYSPANTPQITMAHAALNDFSGRISDAPLNDSSGHISGSSGVTAWINAGLPANKLVFGLPFYGYAWELSNEDNHGLGAPASGVATGDDIDTYGAISFKNIKEFIGNNGAAMMYNSTYVVNYCCSGKTWIGYDDVDAVSAKVSYVKEKGLRGYFAWSVDKDDNWMLSQKASTTLG